MNEDHRSAVLLSLTSRDTSKGWIFIMFWIIVFIIQVVFHNSK
uniref:DUF305 domain-containing protein n=1 Tax=Heterorhabditis bacteriophora TaxID=37862 RepID=A0A1I7WHV6_HETBA